MYPDVSYILYDLFQVKPDSSFFANIKTYGLLQFLSFLSFYTFTYFTFIKEERVFYFRNRKIEILFIHLFFLLVFLISLKLNFWISIVIFFILIPILRSVKPPESKHALYFYFLVGLLLVGYVGSSFQIKLEEFYNSGRLDLDLPLGHGFFGGALFIVFYLIYKSRGKREIYLRFMSSASPYIFLSYGIGKMGCHLSGDGDWGRVNNSIYSYDFLNAILKHKYKHNVINSGCKIDDCLFKHCYELCDYVYPLPLLEAIFAFAVFILMRSDLIPKSVVSLFILIGIMRFSFGFLRDDVSNNIILGISYSQFVSLLLIVLAFVVLIRNKPGN